ncbi:hypothetical protein QJS04_geneDACA015645 [Acorus gramineus]|uniref:Neprosin PEP catalytic domain-containing protein n=1 Tax=Acorus gramineus TaxID=55184 RepID=A0AAV9ALG2_ACOGR|nr:hypothetical protein QJS04_geneDACA015645 [Acorus gramineus]
MDSQDYYGVKGTLTVYGVPGIPKSHGSSAFLVLGRGRDDHFAAIQAGWAVSPEDYGDDRTHFTIVWTTDGFQKEGCVDLSCPGFVQVNKQYTPGFAFPQVSVYNGTQITKQIIISKDKKSGNWWLMIGPDKLPIGYWPNSLFKDLGLDESAKLISLGGIAHAPRYEAGPPMGSGHFPEEGWNKACAITGVQYLDASNNFRDPTDTSKSADRVLCYNVGNPFGTDQHDGLAFFFGGPGGCTN